MELLNENKRQVNSWCYRWSWANLVKIAIEQTAFKKCPLNYRLSTKPFVMGVTDWNNNNQVLCFRKAKENTVKDF